MAAQFAVLFINNDGTGFAGYKQVLEGTRLSAFLADQGCDTTNDRLLVRVDNDIAPADFILQPGNKVVATPTKLQAA